MTDDTPEVHKQKFSILQRLLGAVILLAAVALLVPLVLDGQGLHHSGDSAGIPEEPAFDVRLGDTGEAEIRLAEVKGAVDRDRKADLSAETTKPAPEQEPQKPSVPATALVPAATPAKQASAQMPVPAPPNELPAASSPAKADKTPAVAKAVPAKPAHSDKPDLTVRKEKPEPTPVPETALSDNWAVQLGAFRDVDNAQKVVNDLKAKGFRAYISHHSADVWKVQVGPEIRKERAESLRARIAASTGMSGVMVHYVP